MGKNYKYAVTLKNKIIARFFTLNGAQRKFNGLRVYYNNLAILSKQYEGTADELKIVELEEEKVQKISKIRFCRTHTYIVFYKDKVVINYAWKEPFNKEKWVLRTIEELEEKGMGCSCNLPIEVIAQLDGDPEIEIIDEGKVN